MQIRRSRFFLATVEELAAQPGAGQKSCLVATSLLSGHHLRISLLEFEQLSRVPVETFMELEFVSSQSGLSVARLLRLAHHGLLITDSDDPELSRLARLEHQLRSWPPYAAIFHFMSQWKETASSQHRERWPSFIRSGEKSAAQIFVEARGEPPPAFFSTAPQETVSLQWPDVDSPLSEILLRRRSHRVFDRNASLTQNEISRLLGLTFGAIGQRHLGSDIEIVLKTSPSGGSLHPIEAFPIVLRIAGIRPGIYHYSAESHALELIRESSPSELEKNLLKWGQQQDFVAQPSLVIVLAARFQRNFWKYSKRDNTYNVIQLDGGHLSQTFFLLATEMNLGAFFTGSVNPRSLLDELQLEDGAWGILGMLGCGVPGEVDPEISDIQSFKERLPPQRPRRERR